MAFEIIRPLIDVKTLNNSSLGSDIGMINGNGNLFAGRSGKAAKKTFGI
jgi:hypothetical protein